MARYSNDSPISNKLMRKVHDRGSAERDYGQRNPQLPRGDQESYEAYDKRNPRKLKGKAEEFTGMLEGSRENPQGLRQNQIHELQHGALMNIDRAAIRESRELRSLDRRKQGEKKSLSRSELQLELRRNLRDIEDRMSELER